MYRRTTRGNRIGLSLVGIALILVGTGVALLHHGTFGARPAAEKVYPAQVQQYLNGHLWVYWIVAAVAVIVTALALRWLLVQTRTDRVHRLVLDTERDPNPSSGATSVSASAIVSAIGIDAQAIPGVRRAAVSLSGPPDAPELWMKITVDENADTGDIRAKLVDHVLADARASLEMPEMPAYLILAVSNRSTARTVA